MKFHLTLQRHISWIFVLLLYYPLWGILFIGLFRYRIVNLKKIRRQFQEIKKQIKGPLLICANHLTLLDPLIIMWAQSSWWDYACFRQKLVWNFPKASYVYRNIFSRFFFYAAKTIPVRAGRQQNTKKLLNLMSHLLKNNETIMIFPEGTRSRAGHINKNKLTSGVGYILQEVENITVLCFYLRGKSQQTASTFPKIGENFFCDLKILKPAVMAANTPHRVLTAQVVDMLYQMEQTYFAT